MRVGVIVRQDLTGLGVQTRAISKLLQADKVIAIDFSPLNGNEQHPELVSGDRLDITGWIEPRMFDTVLDGLDVLVTCEIDYSIGYALTAYAKQKGVKTIIVANFEFADWLKNPFMPRPDVIALHSEWRKDEFDELLNLDAPVLRTPIFIDDYNEIYEENQTRSNRFLHVAGRTTQDDRNGTKDLLEAVKLIPEEVKFELVIKTQTVDVMSDDPRVTIDRDSPEDNRDLYKGFDAMVLPRRYAGGCLPMNEALASGLPVIMTDIDPNNKILPKYWLVDAEKKTDFMARTKIDVYSADVVGLAGRIAQFAVMGDKTLIGNKLHARIIATNLYSPESVKKEWDKILKELE